MIWFIGTYLLIGVIYMEAAQLMIAKYYGLKYSTFSYFIATPIWGYFFIKNLFMIIIGMAIFINSYDIKNEKDENRNG